jgi:SAM-dependent methyltransferase
VTDRDVTMRGVDAETLGAYERLSAEYATEWEQQPAPADLHALVEEFFVPGPAADIGCGSGRDTAWLAAHGFQATGFDASPALLEEARRLHPGIPFEQASLPELDTVANGSFANVLCETVIMHLDRASIEPSVRRLVEILAPQGTLYLSWRVTEGDDLRDGEGRLYSAFEPALVTGALRGTEILHDAQATSESSGATIHRIVTRKQRG